jgi:hypothetical protein
MLHLVSRGNETIECDATTAADGSIRVVIRNPDGRVATMSLRGAHGTSAQWQRLVERLTGDLIESRVLNPEP